MPEAPVERLGAAIAEQLRASAAPPPRGLAYLALEHASGTGLHLLDALSAHGIFRKYERVLDLAAGLGATSRWLAARLGCDVLGTALDVGEARAGMELTRRAGLAAQVRLVPAAPHALPVRDRHFTHVWALESLARCPDAARALAEAHRTLRPGGTLAVQELVRGDQPPRVPGWRIAALTDRVTTLRAVGFVEIVVRDRSAEAAERSPRLLAARAQLHARLRTEAARDAGLTRLLAEREALERGIARGGLRVVQIVARRP